MRQPLGFTREANEHIGQLWITVLFTNTERTRGALVSALELAEDLNAYVEVVVMRVVPYPLPVDKPPVSPEFTRKQAMELITAVTDKAQVRIYDCRNPEEALLETLQPHSLVIIGSRAWWPIREQRLARKLRQ